LKIELNKQLQSFFYSGESIIARKQKDLITFDSLIEMEWFKAFHVYMNVENQFQNQFQILISKTVIFSDLPKLPSYEKK